MNYKHKRPVTRRDALKITFKGLTVVGFATPAALAFSKANANPAIAAAIVGAAIPAIIEWIKPKDSIRLGRYRKLLDRFMTTNAQKLSNQDVAILKKSEEIIDMVLGADFVERVPIPDKHINKLPSAERDHWPNI